MAEADISTKACGKCGVVQGLAAFNKNKNRPDGLAWDCRACNKVRSKKHFDANIEGYRVAGKANYEKNRDAYKERAKKWAKDNPEKRSAVCTKYHFANPEKRAAWGKSSRENNPGMYAAHYKARQQRKRKAMPAWANEENIKAIYRQSAWVSRITGVKHHVDHFYPLKSDIVCGLHNEFNLRIIPAFDNLSKGNRVLHHGSTT